jgi:uncharacterized phage protein (TIGR01671 family)
MREIKFRAMDLLNNRIIIAMDKTRLCMSVFNGDRMNEYIPMQYTGLKIKDVEVYEGDLIKARKDFIYEVKFENGAFYLYHANKYDGMEKIKWGLLNRFFDNDMIDILNESKVIGNIYENQDLLN